LRFAGHFHGLRGRHNSQLLTLGADEPDGTYANLFVDALATIVRWMAVGWGNASISFDYEPGLLSLGVDPATLGRRVQGEHSTKVVRELMPANSTTRAGADLFAPKLGSI